MAGQKTASCVARGSIKNATATARGCQSRVPLRTYYIDVNPVCGLWTGFERPIRSSTAKASRRLLPAFQARITPIEQRKLERISLAKRLRNDGSGPPKFRI